MSKARAEPHRLTALAQVDGVRVTYPSAQKGLFGPE